MHRNEGKMGDDPLSVVLLRDTKFLKQGTEGLLEMFLIRETKKTPVSE